MSAPAVSEGEKARALAELYRRLGGTRLPDDFANGAPDTVLLRFLAARGFDVDKALLVRGHHTRLRPGRARAGRQARPGGDGAAWRVGARQAPASQRRTARACGSAACAPGAVSSAGSCCRGRVPRGTLRARRLRPATAAPCPGARSRPRRRARRPPDGAELPGVAPGVQVRHRAGLQHLRRVAASNAPRFAPVAAERFAPPPRRCWAADACAGAQRAPSACSAGSTARAWPAGAPLRRSPPAHSNGPFAFCSASPLRSFYIGFDRGGHPVYLEYFGATQWLKARPSRSP